MTKLTRILSLKRPLRRLTSGASSTCIVRCINASWSKQGGNEKHVRHVKTCQFYEIRVKFKKVEGGKNNFREIGYALKQRKEGENQSFESRTNRKQGGNASLSQGGWMPLLNL